MSLILQVIQSLNQFERFCLWALMISIIMSVAICQLQIHQLFSFGKKAKDPKRLIFICGQIFEYSFKGSRHFS